MTDHSDDPMEIERSIAELLHRDIPPGAGAVELRFHLIRSMGHGRTQAITGDERHGISHNRGVSPLLRKLRAAMHRPDTGAWFTVTTLVRTDGTYTFDYDYDTEPAWPTTPDPDVYQHDTEHFPRSPRHTPPWLTSRLSSPPGLSGEFQG